MSDTVTVFHPVLPGVSTEADKADVERWVEQGWKKSEPKAAKDAREASA